MKAATSDVKSLRTNGREVHQVRTKRQATVVAIASGSRLKLEKVGHEQESKHKMGEGRRHGNGKKKRNSSGESKEATRHQ
jgi:hypothetical protein